MLLALVDDTGDPGTGGRGRPWLSYAAFVLADDKLADAIALRDQAAAMMPGASGDPVNWHATDQDVDDFYGTLRMMANASFEWCWLAVNSSTELSTRQTAKIIHKPAEHRYWVLLWLLERISWLAEDRAEKAEVYIEPCGGLEEAELRRRYRDGLPGGRGAAYRHLAVNQVHVTAPVQMPLLNLADTLAYGVGKALNPHSRRREPFPEYFRVVWPRVWVGPVWGNRSLLNYGFVLLPSSIDTQLAAGLPFITEWQQSLEVWR